MAADGCQCTALEDNRILRQQRWRELCAKFYYDKDETAKRVLDFFEASKVDEISISAVEETGADEQFNEAVQTLGLHKCMVSGHEKNFTKIIEMLEVVKTEVRAGYHEHVSKTRYAEFEIQAKKSQGTNYELTTDKNNRHRVSKVIVTSIAKDIFEKFGVATDTNAASFEILKTDKPIHARNSQQIDKV
ncbi:uncharacterized protein PHALS_10004 [Plasmopara halstedii]|uniref:Uncharacterized protein n=1 Tax=Plasmopara halstedii TaxID=4781 RepID=A0A0P1AH06_PLAHL|nr:uncharacterized protein PHALS_10004 [Plasmopara halstedii]CEG39768.1 hypothetical protein PHALS_10004 [Plasmopara halstedii]|eukprot:XP_024576137.1 hypothetical protein PHALS_10004 [Plasmopara halstedii]